MANTNAVFVRMDAELKENAESILKELGVSASSAVQMFYRQIVLQRGLPFDLKLPAVRPTAIGGMTQAELDAELQKGLDSLHTSPLYSVEDVDRIFAQEYDA